MGHSYLGVAHSDCTNEREPNLGYDVFISETLPSLSELSTPVQIFSSFRVIVQS